MENNGDILLVLSPALTVVLQVVKQIPGVAGQQKWLIPLLALILGGSLYPVLHQGELIMDILNGIIIGSAAVGLHQMARQAQKTMNGKSTAGE